MTKIKSFTSLEQSKMLAEILPIESADMYYTPPLVKGHIAYIPHLKRRFPIDWDIEQAIPCWSLAALLDFLKDKIIFGGNSPEGWFCCYTIKNPTKLLTIDGDSLVDACVAMIEELHDLKCCDYEDNN